MKYALRVLALGHSKRIDITAPEFEEIEYASKLLIRFSKFTENYRVVAETYRTLELKKHEVMLDHILEAFDAYNVILDNRMALNAAVLAYLSAARYFLDSSDRLIPQITDESGMATFKAFRSKIYDATPEYKFVEELRNYVQHRSLPVEGMRYHNFVEDSENHEKSDLVTSVSLLLARKTLEEDEKFKTRALEGMADSINVVHCIRVHISGIWALHDYIVNTHGEIAANARKTFETQLERFKTQVGGSTIGLHAVRATDGEVIESQIPILLNWDDARLVAIRRLGNLKNLPKRYVTGKIQREK